MHLQEFYGSWMEHPFWRTNFVVEDPQDLIRIVDSGIHEVSIDSGKGLDVPGETETQVAEATDAVLEDFDLPEASEPQRVSMSEELRRAARICISSSEAVVSMFQEVRMGKAIDAKLASELVEEISSSVLRNPGALISLSRLRRADDYMLACIITKRWTPAATRAG